MPNVNLIEEEGGGEGAMEPIAAPMRKGGGGGGGSKVLLIVIILVVVGGGVFALNKFGIIKLWGKKPQPVVVAQIPEEQFTAEQYADTTALTDTSGVSFVETPPLTEQKEPEMTSGLVLDRGGKRTALSGSAPVSSKLGEMTGNYTIQVSAWRDKSTAETYVKRLEEAGYPAFVEQRSVKDGSWYTVRIGRYSSIKEAKKAVDSFAYELKANYWIDRVQPN
ncbi:MAG TPA: SPOR domain-containing protein [Bacteroidota bacterium]|nr:SPOR domain-containing protein [Bacteroidota bacterium]